MWDADLGRYVDPLYEQWAAEARQRQRLAAERESQEGIGFWDWVQGGLDAGGVVEPTPFCDLASGVISAFRGNWADAGCSALAMIPYVGDTAKAAKYGRKAAKLANRAGDVAHAADKIADAARAADKASDAAKTAKNAAGKLPPNPYGKLGGPAHQAKVGEVAEDIRSRGLIPRTEAPIGTVNGQKATRVMDVVAVDPATGRIVEVHQVGKTLKSDPKVPIARERDALRDVRHSPEIRGAKRYFHEY